MNRVEFFEHNPASAEGAHQLVREQERLEMRSSSQSRVAFIADRFISQSNSNLRSLSAPHNLTPEIAQRITRQGIADVSGIVFANAVKIMEIAAIEKTLYTKELIGNINEGLVGTGCLMLDIGEMQPERGLVPDELTALYTNIQRDKTFSFVARDSGVPGEILGMMNVISQNFDQDPQRFIKIAKKWEKLMSAVLNPWNQVPNEQDMLEDGFSSQQIKKYTALSDSLGQ